MPVDVAMSARIVRKLIALPSPPSEIRALIGPAINALLAAAPSVRHPDAWGALLHLLLDLQAQDAAGGRWEPTIKSLAIELVNAQDIAGTWTKKAEDAPACTDAVSAAWALERLARTRGGDAKLEHAATSAAEWAHGKQKTNGYFYACTWSSDPTTNPLLTELVDTAEGLLALGLSRGNKHYRAAGLLTARELLKRVPDGQLAMGAWTSELNTERHRSPLGTLRLADLCQLAATAPGPEQLGVNFAGAVPRLRQTVRSAQVATVAGWPEASGGIASTLPAWGRPYPFALSTEATGSWLANLR